MMPVYASIVLARRDGYVGLGDISKMLGRRRQTVHLWMKRRRTSKFPLPCAVYRDGSRLVELYDESEVKTWCDSYVPLRGGAPIGNRNWRRRTTS